MQAKTLLRETGCLPSPREQLTCWQCGDTLVPASSSSRSSSTDALETLQCPQCRTASRHPLKLCNAKHAYTVFWTSMNRGFSPQYKLFVRTAFLFGIKVPLDSMLHCVGDSENPVGRDLLRKWIDFCKFALAFCEIEDQQKILFKQEIVEMDGSKTLIHKGTSKTTWFKRNPRFPQKSRSFLKKPAAKTQTVSTKRGTGKKAVHHGRMLFVKGRFSKQCVALPIRPAATRILDSMTRLRKKKIARMAPPKKKMFVRISKHDCRMLFEIKLTLRTWSSFTSRKQSSGQEGVAKTRGS